MTGLSVSGFSAGYGRLRIIRSMDLEVGGGAGITAILGANGAGKTTLCRALTGVLESVSGSASFLGQELVGRTPAKIVDLGIRLVPEGRMIFSGLSVEENLLLGGTRCGSRQEQRRRLTAILEEFPVLGHRRRAPASVLSGGEQQLLAIGRALMTRPKMLILDEPSHGLSPIALAGIAERLKQLRADGCSILLIEQSLRFVESLADRVIVMANGQIVEDGGGELLSDGRVAELYLGVD